MMKKSLISDALGYLNKGFPVIPINPKNKKPIISWKEYQNRLSTEDEIRGWWEQYPNAMIGVVTGSLSGLCVVDIDRYAEDYDEPTELKYFPEGLITPTCQTPRGGSHLYFRHPQDINLTVNARALPGIDFRGQGGYIVAPPSKNGTGKGYKWAEGMSFDDVPLAPLPRLYSTYLNNRYRGTVVSDNNRQHLTANDSNLFTQGRRDEDLYHAAHCLIKGGMVPDCAAHILDILALNCKPPFLESEAQIKIQSALDRAKRKERSLTQDIRELFMTTSDNISTTFLYQVTTCDNRDEKKKALVILGRLVEEGFIQRVSSGVYRRVDAECEDIDFVNIDDTILDITWPFRIEELVQIMPGNIVIIAGEPNAGKTAFLLNLVKDNMRKHDVYYFSSEMGPMEFKKRLVKFDLPLNRWKFHPKERTSNFADVIQPDAINIIDFLEIYDEFYKIGAMIREVYDKLNKGTAVIAIQKNKGNEYGLGGTRGLEKARLYLNIEPGKARIIKAKNWASFENPNGLEIDFKLAQGCKFFTDTGWQKP